MGNNIDSIFPKGNPAPADRFTGSSFVNPLLPGNREPYFCQISDVYFEKKSRNNWHIHPAGQVLLATAGTGYYQERGKKAQKLEKGDMVEVPMDVEHWHGAAPDSDFIHISITPNMPKGDAKWLNPVTDKEYEEAML